MNSEDTGSKDLRIHEMKGGIVEIKPLLNWCKCRMSLSEIKHPAESSENTSICAKIRKFVFDFEELLPPAILDQFREDTLFL